MVVVNPIDVRGRRDAGKIVRISIDHLVFVLMGNGLTPFYRKSCSMRIHFQPLGLFSNRRAQLADSPETEQTPCLHFSRLLSLRHYFMENRERRQLCKLTGNRALVHYALFAISRVLPTVPRIRLSCILCTWFPLRRSEDKGHSIRWVTFHPVLDKSLW